MDIEYDTSVRAYIRTNIQRYILTFTPYALLLGLPGAIDIIFFLHATLAYII